MLGGEGISDPPLVYDSLSPAKGVGMSRVIDLKKPLSEKDAKYLQSRGRHEDVERNKKKFANAKTQEPEKVSEEAADKPATETKGGEKLQLDSDIFEKVKGLTSQELSAELKKHGLKAPATEREQRITLAKWLQDHRDSQ